MVILGLCGAARPLISILWSSCRAVLVLTLLPEAVWNSVVRVPTEDRQFLLAYSTRQSCSVSLCGLPLCSWAGVAPRFFHFTITALTVDRKSLAGQKFDWLVGKVASYDDATLKVTELFSKAILLPMFVYGDCMAVCSILYTRQQRVWLK